MRRLDAYLIQGQPRMAEVVQVTPQPLPSSTTGAQQQPANGQQLPLANQPTTAPQGTPATTTPHTSTATTPGGTPAALPPSTTELFKIQVRLEGRLFELITQQPLPSGSRVLISLDSGNRISLQSAPPASQAAAPQVSPQPLLAVQQPGAQSAPPSTPTMVSTTASPSTGKIAANQATPLIPSPTTTSDTLTTAAAPPRNQSTPPKADSAPSHAAAPRPAAADSVAQAVVDRIKLQPLKAELPIRAGQRLTAEVISSRPNPAAPPAPPSPTIHHNSYANPVAAAANIQAPAAQAGGDNHTIRITLQGHKIELVSPRPLPPGSQLQLIQDSKGQLWAELPSAKTQAIEQALREHLPQQLSPAPLLNLLSSSQASGQLRQAQPLLLNLINLLTGRSLTNPHKTEAETVKQQVQNSGSLLENKLARGETQNLGQDHKALLLRLAQQLHQPSNQAELPKALSQQISQLTQQALSRVLVNQITSGLSGQTQETGIETNRTLALDIPVAWQHKTENLQLKIQREDNNTDEETDEMQYRWRVRLNFEIDGRRQLEAELSLESERVSVIWSGDRSIRDQVERQLNKLQQRLELIGLEVQTLGVRERLPDSGPALKPPRSQLIDITT